VQRNQNAIIEALLLRRVACTRFPPHNFPISLRRLIGQLPNEAFAKLESFPVLTLSEEVDAREVVTTPDGRGTEKIM